MRAIEAIKADIINIQAQIRARQSERGETWVLEARLVLYNNELRAALTADIPLDELEALTNARRACHLKIAKTAHIVCYDLAPPVRNIIGHGLRMRCHCHNCGCAWAAGEDGWIYCPHCGAQNNALEVMTKPESPAK